MQLCHLHLLQDGLNKGQPEVAVATLKYGLPSIEDSIGLPVKEEPKDTTVVTSISTAERWDSSNSKHIARNTQQVRDSLGYGMDMNVKSTGSTEQASPVSFAQTYDTYNSLVTNVQKGKEISSGNKLLKCSNCDIVFSNRGELKAHMVQAHSRNEFKCKYCGKGFLTITGLQSHVPLHDGQWKFSCPLCGKGFQRKLDFEGHMNKHNNIKFICPNCEGSFFHKANWLKHQSRCGK